MENKKINKVLTLQFFLALFASICLGAGIPLLIMGAVKHITLLLVLGIVILVFGFYGTPLLWIVYSGTLKTKKILQVILEENLTKVDEIATQLSISANEIKSTIYQAISKRYLVGYLFNGFELTKNEKINKAQKTRKCPNCGGNMQKQENGTFICTYCKTKME